MAQDWISRMARKASALGLTFRMSPRALDRSADDADSRRMRADLNAIRTRFPDHS